MKAGRLFNRDFLLLWQGQLVSQVGNQAFFVALMFWTMGATGSASLMGLLMMSSALPGVLLGPFAGTFADRHSRKIIIVVADLARGIAVLLLAGLLMLRADSTGLILSALFVVALFSGVVGSVFNPAITASIPDLVPRNRVQSANSLNQLSSQGATFVGQAAGGVLFQLLGAPLLFLVDGVSYLLSALSESFIRIPQSLPARATTSRDVFREYARDTLVGFRYVWGWVGMRTFILTAAAMNFLFMPVFVLLPFYVTDVLGGGAEWYGFLLASMSLGSLVGLGMAGVLQLQGHARGRVLRCVLLGMGVLMGTLGVVRIPVLSLLVTFALGGLSAMINIFFVTLMQLSTPADLRGRVMGMSMALSGAAAPLGMAAGGIIGDMIGRRVPVMYVTVGLAAVAIVLSVSASRSFREFLATDAPILQ